MHNEEPLMTTVGRVVFNNALPEGLRFINETIKKKSLRGLLDRIFDDYGQEVAVQVADDIKNLGFEYATQSGLTISALSIDIPQEKEELMKYGDEKTDEIYKYFYKGFLTEDEKHRQIVEVWTSVKDELERHAKELLLKT